MSTYGTDSHWTMHRVYNNINIFIYLFKSSGIRYGSVLTPLRAHLQEDEAKH